MRYSRRLTAMLLTATVGVTLPATALADPDGNRGNAPPPGFGPVRVTLVTGDQVVVRPAPDGTRTVRVRRARGRETMPFVTRESASGGLLVLPADALPPLEQGTLDERLFDVDLLTRWGYDDARRSDIPVLAERRRAGRPGAVGDARRVTSLNTLGLDALRIPKRRARAAWTSLTRNAHAGSLGGGVARLWLDGLRTASLDGSVRQIGAPAAWQKGLTGKGTTVAVLDTGVDGAHPDLSGAVTRSRGFTDLGPGLVQDGDGHGTHVASTIAGSGRSSGGRYRGVAPDAHLAVGKVLSDSGVGYDSWVLAGMEWAVTTAKAKIVNLSLGGPDTPGADPLERAVDTLSAQSGALFVVAAGNEGERGQQTIASPGSADAALTVGAVDDRDAVAAFSSRGPRVGDHALKPDVTAPGVDITAAAATATGAGPYLAMTGTSMATPHVAGAAALLAQRHPGWTGRRLKAALMNTARPSAGETPFTQGAGRVDVARAVSQQVTASTGSVSGRLRWPRRTPVTRTVTYANTGSRPVTLSLRTSGSRLGGGSAPKGMFTVGRTRVTVPAKGTVRVPVRIAAGRRAATGTYSGVLTARGRNVTVRTAMAAEVSAPQARRAPAWAVA